MMLLGGMQPLVGSISRSDLPNALSLPETVIDALIESGFFLCHLKNGEMRVPVSQLESFFRDGLMNVYRAAANELPVEAPVAVKIAEPVQEEAPIAPLAIVPISAVPETKPVQRPNARVAQRYIPRRQIDGNFKDARFTVLQLSATGLRIRHSEPFLPGDEAKLSFALLNPPRSFVIRARVVWTSVARYENDESKTFCISGLRVIEHADRLDKAIAILKEHHQLQPDTAAVPHAREDVQPLGDVSDDEVALVVKAAQRFASDPLEASRWYGRARFAVADEQVRKTAPRAPRDREEVLGIWEYLDRQIGIPKIAGVLSWMRQAKHAEA